MFMVSDQTTTTTPKTHLKSKPTLKRGSNSENELLTVSSEIDRGYSEKPKNDFRAECKFVFRLRIEALREYYRLRLSLIHEEQKNAPSMEIKATYSTKLKELVDEFDSEKRQVKQELRSKNVDEELLKKHYIQIGKHQSETLRLNSRLATIQRIMSSKSYGSAQSRSTSRFASSSSSSELQKPPQSPLSLERFITKYPQNNTSRKTSCCEDAQSDTGPLVELLEELPDATQIGMPLDISQTSENILNTTDGTNDIVSVDHNHNYLHQKKLIKKYVHKLWSKYKTKGNEFEPADVEDEEYDFEVQNENDGEGGGANQNNNMIPDNMMLQLCAEYLYMLIQNAPFTTIARRALSSKKMLANYLQNEILENNVICSEAVEKRARDVSHFFMDTNRLLLAKYVYETVAWPSLEIQRKADMDIRIIEEFFCKNYVPIDDRKKQAPRTYVNKDVVFPY